MKILLTGGAGFVGSHIADILLGNGHDVLIVDNLSTGSMRNVPVGASFLMADVSDGEKFISVAERFRPDYICHQAAQPSLLTAQKDIRLDVQTNVMGMVNVILAARAVHARIVFASTSAVFPKKVTHPDENTPPRPQRIYGVSKYAAEMYLKASGVKFSILRYGNVYGPRQVPVGENQLIARAFSHVYLGTDFAIYGDGSHKRDFVFVGDVARANLFAVHMALEGVYHVGTGVATSVSEIVERIFSITGRADENIQYKKAVRGEPKEITLRSVRWEKKGGWYARVLLDEGLRRTNDYWKTVRTV